MYGRTRTTTYEPQSAEKLTEELSKCVELQATIPHGVQQDTVG